MKKLFCLFVITFFTNEIFARTLPVANQWKATVNVVDEAGGPVANAHIGVGFFDSGGKPSSIDGFTDTNGIFIATHNNTPGMLGFLLSFRAEKAGYYATWVQRNLGPGYSPEKWNQTIILTLKKTGKPIAMYAKKEETKMPKEDEPVGFDLTVGDWVAPYGAGKIADIFFAVHRKITSALEYDAVLKLTFPNKGDGIVIAPAQPETGSDFKTSRTAREYGYNPGQTWHYSNSEAPPSVFGYFIRVRTVLDDNGNVKSALYGKINGDVRFYVGTKAPSSGIGFDYCLNPTPNDLNVEFDPAQNLLGGLSFMECIKEP